MNAKVHNQIYHTANALEWGNNNSYQFRENTEGSNLKIIPISGVEMVGTNCTLFEYENDIMIVDAGLGFPGEMLVGVDGLVPNLSYLYDKKDKVRGLVITHGHTDHIGGIHHIIEKIGFPMIYAPKLAAGLIREKLKETPYAAQVKITEIDGDSTYYLGKFRVSHFKMTHTIPDNYGVCVDTPVGRIVSTSDYKFDSSPYNESPSDYSKLAKLGDEGVLLALDESTNAKKQGWSESETDIAKDMEDIIRSASGRVIIGMFSTMVNRIRQIVEIADRQGKKVAVLGRSLETIVRITHGLGYINVSNSVFVPFEEINRIGDDKIVILTTGSQGEANAALMRIAKGEHPKVQLKSSDTVVFSSSRIPGNETKIDYLINMITERGVKVLTNDYLTLHATGHGFQEDHKLMIRLLKPKFFMPVHGEPSMLAAHRETAMMMGYPEQNIIMPANGMVIEVWKDGWKINGSVESTPLWVEGNRVGDFDPMIVEDRRVLMDEGVIMVAVKNQATGEFPKESVDIHHRGFFVQKNDEFFFQKLPNAILHTINGLNDRGHDTVKSVVKRYVENELQRYYEKRPMVVVSVL
jgi:ribonuclease J